MVAQRMELAHVSDRLLAKIAATAAVRARIRMHFRGLWPDNVRPQSEVVVRGHLTFDGNGWVVEATDLLSRCGGTYRNDGDLDTIYK